MTGFPAAALNFEIMSNQNNNYQNNHSGDYGRRYRNDGASDYSNRYDGNFDVSQERYQRPRQSYDNRNRQYPNDGGYRQGYDGRGRQQYPQRQQYYDDRAYRQGYDNRSRQQYPSDYDDHYQNYNRNARQRPQNYDNYYGRRPQNGYDNRNPRGRKRKKRTSTAIIVVRVIAIIMLIVGAAIIGIKLYHSYSDKKGHAELAQLSANYEELYNRNHDFFGWLKIDDTVIDYPVMYVPGDNDTYLHTDFDGDYSESGELFMDGYCNPDGLHYLIYGHHMFNGSMFGSLPKYDDIDYYNEHKTLHFNTRFETADYEIFAVFYSQIYDEDDDSHFEYYECQNLDDEASYNYYVENVKSLSTIDTGITPQYGERIITLSTCNYHTDDGRFVVSAVKRN